MCATSAPVPPFLLSAPGVRRLKQTVPLKGSHRNSFAGRGARAQSKAPSSDSLVGATIKISGLQSKPELNDATAFVVAHVAKSARYCVSVTALPGGELRCVVATGA